MSPKPLSRRTFLSGVSALLLPAAEPVIDIHQHTNYLDRTDEELVRHQQTMGITKTVLHPAGSKLGLAVNAGGNDSVVALARQHPDKFLYFANEAPDLPEARRVMEKYLKTGAIGIGEQKFPVEVDSKAFRLVPEIARDFGVPILMHFQHKHYNFGLDRFHKVLEAFPKVIFIGHAQTWWGHIDRNHDPEVLYPKTRFTPGGITDRLLADYPNMYGDLSSGSGLNAVTRDEEHAREFLERHQDKLMFGSDCSDRAGQGEGCIGSKLLAAIRRLATPEVARKILYANASRVLKIQT